jgi:hypothetical protein
MFSRQRSACQPATDWDGSAGTAVHCPLLLVVLQLAEHHYRLGEVYWKLRGRYRTEKQFAYAHFFDAASVEGHAQAPAFAALGRCATPLQP